MKKITAIGKMSDSAKEIKMVQENKTLSAQIVRLDKIMANHNINSRSINPTTKKYDGQEELTASMKAHGLLTPILITPAGKDKYALVAGFMRFEAAKELGWKEILAAVREVDTTSDLNLIENLDRHNLNSYDLATRVTYLFKKSGCADIKTFVETKLPGVLSVPYAQQLVRMREKLVPEILAAWSKNPGAFTTNSLNRLSVKTPEEQKKWYADFTAAPVKDSPKGSNSAETPVGEGPEPFRKKAVRPVAEIRDKLELLNKEGAKDRKSAEIRALEWVLNMRDVI